MAPFFTTAPSRMVEPWAPGAGALSLGGLHAGEGGVSWGQCHPDDAVILDRAGVENHSVANLRRRGRGGSCPVVELSQRRWSPPQRGG